jgi:Uma2 family endonuclease
MSAELKQKKKLTPEEYLELEEKAEYKSEYWDGVMVPLHGEPAELAGATESHNTITLNIAVLFRLRLEDRCRTYSSEMKVRVEKKDKFYYPDVLVVCDELKFYQNRRTILENPTIVVEVLSGSTTMKDRTEKLWAYQSLESVKEYILVSQDKPVVEKYARRTDDEWSYSATIGLESSVKFNSIGITLTLKEIYNLVEFEIED